MCLSATWRCFWMIIIQYSILKVIASYFPCPSKQGMLTTQWCRKMYTLENIVSMFFCSLLLLVFSQFPLNVGNIIWYYLVKINYRMVVLCQVMFNVKKVLFHCGKVFYVFLHKTFIIDRASFWRDAFVFSYTHIYLIHR